MSEVGALVINLQAETAQFREALSKAQAQLDALAAKSGEAGSAMDYSFKEARGGLMLTEEIIGVHLPRELTALIAGIDGVGAAFAVMLPILGVVAAVAVIAELAEKHEKLAIAIAKGAEETANLAVKGNDEVATLELQNLKIQDQITKIQGGVPHNGLKEALLEAGIAADKLASSFASSFQKINDELRESAELTDHWGTKILEIGAAAATGGASGAGALIANMQMTSQAIKQVNKDYEAQKDIRTQLADAVANGDAKTQASAQAALIASYQTLEKDAKYALATINENTDVGAKQAADLRQQILGAADAQREFAQQTLNAAAAAKLAKLEDQHQGNPGAESALEDAKKLADQQFSIAMSTAKELYDQKKITLAEEVELEKDAVSKQLAAQIAYYEGKKAIMGTTAAQAATYDNDEVIARTKADEEMKAIDADAWKTRLDLVKAAVAESVSAAMKGDQQMLASAAASAADEAEIRNAYAAQDKSALANAVTLGLINRRQELEGEIQIAAAEYQAKKEALDKEVAAKSEALNKEISLEQDAAAKILAANGGNKEDPAYLKYLDDVATKQAQLAQITEKYNADSNAALVQNQTQLAATTNALAKLNSSWVNYFQQMKTSTLDLSSQIRTTLQNSINQFTTSFANSMAKSIVENKNLGQAVRQTAAQMLESMLSMIIKWAEEWVLSHTIMRLVHSTTEAQNTATTAASTSAQKVLAAGLAGANMMASYSLAPFPIDTGAPAMAAAAAATALSFEVGGTIPGSGPVPIIGHGGETVVTKALTDRVNKAESGGMKEGGGINFEDHSNYSAMDAKGLKRVLKSHRSEMIREVRAIARSMNR